MLHAPIQAQRRLLPDDAPLDLAVVIPARLGAGRALALLATLERTLGDVVWEAIFVEDGPADGTAEALREIGRRNIRVRVLQRIGRRGRASAAAEGMLASSAPIVAVIDPEPPHDERLLRRLFSAVRDGGCDLAVGSRFLMGRGHGDWDEIRSAASRWVGRQTQAVMRTRLTDPASGVFAISRTALTGALPRLSGRGDAILLDLVVSSRAALRVIELPCRPPAQARDEGKHELVVALECLKLVLDQSVGRFVPVRLIPFLAVEGLGLAVELGLLCLLTALGFLNTPAQLIAVWSTMTVKFFVNNAVTFNDRRLNGWRIVPGLLSFYAVCLIGAAAGTGLGTSIQAEPQCGWTAGIAAALIGVTWNFAASNVMTWRKSEAPSAG